MPIRHSPEKPHVPAEEISNLQSILIKPNETKELQIDLNQLSSGQLTAGSNEIIWHHWSSIPDDQTLATFLQAFNIHSLVQEDVYNPKQQPKFEDYGDYLFITAVVFGHNSKGISGNQIYLLMGENYVISIQRKSQNIFSRVHQSLFNKRLPEEHRRSDFLLYTLIDCIVDDYFLTLDRLNDKMEKIDQKLFSRNNADILPKIHRVKRDSIRIKRTLAPIREGLLQLMRGDFPLFSAKNHLFVRDSYDHSVQLCDSFDSIRDTVQSMMDIYLSYQSNALNKQMRVLTAITILFMPLTLIVGIYGMNFDHMPELHWRYGYLGVLLAMVVISTILLRIFHKQDWL